ncbi:hypothetical protein SAMN04488508_11118 [Aquimarina spongiae]|uniref:Uncharacterized protein n=1 Tax=Aquimarina spongiae TaxID=570521 RepID=A0A1M6KHA9_9FLAO|nr:hypothetical protein SAMN04488508_11118 [Aquimarina spongiae]
MDTNIGNIHKTKAITLLVTALFMKILCSGLFSFHFIFKFIKLTNLIVLRPAVI